MQPFTANTLTQSAGAEPPAARIEDLSWLIGSWRGEGLDGTVEEIWSGPLAGTMMGMFRLIREDRPQFYELICLAESSGSLVMRLKHFHADLKGWEDRDKVVEFPLVKLGEREAFFDGLTLRRRGDLLEAFAAFRAKDGGLSELVFQYRRVRDEPL